MNAVVLTESQQLVFDQLILGKSNRQIGAATGTSEKTVKQHITHILKKFGCETSREVIARHYLESK